jgi:hypothetical protein
MLRLLLALFLLIPMPVLADHVPTQPAYGQDLTTDNTAGTITIGILSSDGFEDSPPENYTIFFSGSSGITETNSFCVTTSFGHQTNTWQYYTFSNDDLKYYFADLAGKNFYFAIRSNNETDNSVSTLTTESVYNIYAGVAFEFNQTDWSAPTGTDACNPYVVTTTTTTSTTTTVPDTTTTSSTTTTTTTTTVPPPPPPPPPPPEPEKVEVVMDDGSTAEYKPYEVEDGTVDRDNQRKSNENKFGCYMTDAQIERGDCDIIIDDEKPDTKTELPDDDVVVLEVEFKDEIKEPEPIIEEDIVEEEIKIDVEKLEEDFKFEEPEIIIEDIPEDIIIIIEDNIIKETPEIPEEVLVEPIQENVKEEPAKVVEVPVEVIVVQEITEEQVEEVQAVVNTAIANVEKLTEEQVEVVAEVLQVPTKDVKIIAEAVKTNKVVAKAVEVYVERAIENKNVENYTLADVVTEIQFEQFIENPIEIFININNIDISTIGDDMTQDQKEKAQEVVVPVILTRIASMAAFIFRRS